MKFLSLKCVWFACNIWHQCWCKPEWVCNIWHQCWCTPEWVPLFSLPHPHSNCRNFLWISFIPTYKEFHYQWGPFTPWWGPFHPREVGGFGGGLCWLSLAPYEHDVKKWRLILFHTTRAHRVALISVPIAMSQTLSYTVRTPMQGRYIMWYAWLPSSFRWYKLHLSACRLGMDGWPGWVDPGSWLHNKVFYRSIVGLMHSS